MKEVDGTSYCVDSVDSDTFCSPARQKINVNGKDNIEQIINFWLKRFQRSSLR